VDLWAVVIVFEWLTQLCAQGNNANCDTAFHKSTDTHVQVQCKDRSLGSTSISYLLNRLVLKSSIGQVNDVNLVITFCK